ncbi:hypothetical protein KC675_01410 [Candidatus Dojkabacteria bacterium]|uniref:DUF2680 domain-containing protein n=1 Tax=Candidatus Dojkabacteria bacterium TaxID=2099670 RepID=A0A955L0U1_9BACT|nr:hypothetical protein [Candidatus Dojkabacteria bacterium]
MTKNKLLILGAGVVVSASTLGVVAVPTFAQDSETYPPMVETLSEKFNLDKAEVQNVFTEERKSRHEERLNGLVEDGSITEEQKAVIEEHHEEMMAKRDSLFSEGKTRTEMHELMDTEREEFQKWLDDQGIEMPMKGPRGDGQGQGGRGNGMGMGRHAQ